MDLSTTGRAEVQKVIDDADKLISELTKDITRDRDLVAESRELTEPTRPDPALIQGVNKLLGTIKARYSDARLQEATNDGFIVDAKNLVAAATLHTDVKGR